MRGKNKGWTEEQDILLLSGKRVEGRNSLENCNRRYKIRNLEIRNVAEQGRRFARGLLILQATKRFKAGKDFITSVKDIVKKLEEQDGK